MQQGFALRLDRVHDHGVAVSEAVGGDAGDEIEIVRAVFVPDAGAFAAHERDGQAAGGHHEDGGFAFGGGGGHGAPQV